MTYAEQELILFFRLYLLARRQNYIDYMKDAVSLATWFRDVKKEQIDRRQRTIVFCGNCFNVYFHMEGGSILTTCEYCHGSTNLGYEINELARILRIDYKLCVYLLCRAVEDIYKCRNDVTVMEQMLL